MSNSYFTCANDDSTLIPFSGVWWSSKIEFIQNASIQFFNWSLRRNNNEHFCAAFKTLLYINKLKINSIFRKQNSNKNISFINLFQFSSFYEFSAAIAHTHWWLAISIKYWRQQKIENWRSISIELKLLWKKMRQWSHRIRLFWSNLSHSTIKITIQC